MNPASELPDEPEVFADAPARSRLRQGISLALLGIYLAVLAMVTLSPVPVDQGYESAIQRLLAVLHDKGFPEWFGYNALEFSANIVMFVPLGFLFGLALPFRLRWWALAIAPVLSLAIELVQAGVLTARFATVNDVIANTVGGVLGALLALLFRAIVRRRDAKLIARVLWEHDRRVRHPSS